MIIDERRSFGTYILLSLVTCGIYHFVFFSGIARDMNIICDGDGEETPSIGEFILFSILTCGIYSIYWYYKLGNRQEKNAGRYNLQMSENGTTVVVWLLLGSLIAGIGSYIAMYILIKNMNLLAYAYNHNGGNAQAQPGLGGYNQGSYNPPNYNNPNYAQSNGYNQNTNGVSLICRSGEFAGCSFPINMNESVTIGRNPSCNIKFSPNTPKVSRTHCTVFYDGMVWIIDNGSSYGTFLDNGTKLIPNSKMMLQKGSGFYLGNRDISFYIN